MWRAGMALIGAIRNILRKFAAVAFSSPQTSLGTTCLNIHFNGLLVETVAAG